MLNPERKPNIDVNPPDEPRVESPTARLESRPARRGAPRDVDGIVRALRANPELRDRFVHWTRW